MFYLQITLIIFPFYGICCDFRFSECMESDDLKRGLEFEREITSFCRFPLIPEFPSRLTVELADGFVECVVVVIPVPIVTGRLRHPNRLHKVAHILVEKRQYINGLAAEFKHDKLWINVATAAVKPLDTVMFGITP